MMRLRIKWILNVALWIGLALIQSFQLYSSSSAEGGTPHIGPTLALQFATWLPWAFLAPGIFHLSQRYPLEKFPSVRTLILLPLVGIGCVLLQVESHTAAMVLYPDTNWTQGTFGAMYIKMLRWMIFPQLIVFAGIVGASHAIAYYRKFRERELHTAQLERQLTEAQLLTLQMQLQPHFFFNTLHSIASLVRDRQNDAAVTMIAQLSDLLRYTLDQVDRQLVPLRQELEFIKRYLDIERVRFPDKLRVDMQIDPALLDAQVPSLLLQPLVENAIKHGISLLPQPGALDICIRRDQDDLYIDIANDGIGFRANGHSKGSDGVGLSNVRERLHQLYGPHHTIAVQERNNGKVEVSLRIPYQCAKGQAV